MPELSRLMEDQLATLEPAIAARQEARLHERISANRYALTPKEAAEKFPGYRITPTPLPGSTTGGGPSRLIYLAEDDVDPRLEAEAFHLLHTASAWGDPVKLEALDRDPAVAAVLRIPGSNFADAYIAAVTEARASQPFASATDGLPPATAFPNDASQNFSAQNSVPLGESIASLASESGTEATAPTTPDGTADSSAATTAPETAPSPASVTLEEQLAALKSVDENWRQQRPVEARSSLGGSPYVDRIRAIETGIEIRDHLLAFIEINRLQLLRDAALESDDGPTIRKLNREIGDLGRKVFGQSISGIDANGHPIAGVEEIFFAGTFGGGIGRAGKLGERALEKYGGRPQAFFRTEWGARYIDRLAKEIARESKVGYTVLSERILIQIAKDVELLREAEVKGVVWHFFRSPVTGEGPSQPLKDALKAAGIKWMFGVRK